MIVKPCDCKFWNGEDEPGPDGYEWTTYCNHPDAKFQQGEYAMCIALPLDCWDEFDCPLLEKPK